MASRVRELRALGAAIIKSDRSTQVRPIAVIDIGSNSVRLVVFDGLQRSPQTLFNEKVLCGLGKEVGATGNMGSAAVESAMSALERYAQVIENMGCRAIKAVATAAVRDAANGPWFVEEVKRRTGLDVEVIDGAEEARFSALGVISGIQNPSGIVGDLGGGSLELIRIEDGQLHERVTLPIGPVRLLGEDKSTPSARRKRIDKALKSVEWLRSYPDQPLYIVGGAWRALARIHIQRSKHPLGILHQHEMTPTDVNKVYRLVRRIRKNEWDKFENIPQRRIETLPAAARILDRVVSIAGASQVVVSALGLREGVLYEQLEENVRKRDPLIAACRQISLRYNRFGIDDDVLMAWLDPVFEATAETAEQRRLRRAAALMSDISWRGHPDFRAESAIYASLFGWFVGVGARGRASIGLALYLNYGGSENDDLAQIALQLLSEEEKHWARRLGLALRLAQRFSAGTQALLQQSKLIVQDGGLGLRLAPSKATLYGDVVDRRLNDLAKACDLKPIGCME